MINRVLCVDDDRSLLRTLERNLCFDFELSTTESCEGALKLIDALGEFSVIVVDMCMPGVDGIQTIGHLRAKLPNAVFIMLTGNQDVTTAVQAVNQGRVFRFLSKPCEMDEIRRVIKEAQHHQHIAFHEKELLVDTMLGSINVLSEFAELSSDHLVTPEQIKDRFWDIAEAFQIEVTSEELVACRVLSVGLLSMSEQEKKRLKEIPIFYPDHHLYFTKLCQQSAKIVARIPQFAPIASLFNSVPHSETLDDLEHPKRVIATILRITFYWSLMDNKGIDRAGITAALSQAMPNITPMQWEMVMYELGCKASNSRSPKAPLVR